MRQIDLPGGAAAQPWAGETRHLGVSGGLGLGWCRFLFTKSCSVPSLERITGRSGGPLGHFL